MHAGLHSSQQLQSHHTPRRNPPAGVNLKQPCFNVPVDSSDLSTLESGFAQPVKIIVQMY